MNKAVLRYLPVDWPAAAMQCVDFRRDAWRVSYGTIDGFSEADTLAWFEALANNQEYIFLHVWLAEKIIGQIEYRAPVLAQGSIIGAYINLLYLIPSHRGCGLGQQIHDKIISDLRSKDCQQVRLRVIKSNTAARRFYAVHGWQAVGEVDGAGAQLMQLNL